MKQKIKKNVYMIPRPLPIDEQARRHALLMQDYDKYCRELTGIQAKVMATSVPHIIIDQSGKFDIKYRLDAVQRALNDQVDAMCRLILQGLLKAYGLAD